MQKDFLHRWNITEISLSLSVLFVLLFYTYGILLHVPYTGFVYDPNDAKILGVYTGDDPALKIGDRLVRIGDLSWEEFHENNRLVFFENAKPGDIVEIVIQREGKELTIPWQVAGFTQREFSYRFFNIWLLAYVYWIFGTATLLFIRPRDALGWLLIAANYLTALFLIFGSMSAWHLWESSTLLHAVTWLLLPVFLHTHWIFPSPLRPTSKWALTLLYSISSMFALAELVQTMPKGLYAFGFLLALLGSAVLLGIHFIKRPAQRREVSLPIIATLLVILPLIVLLIRGVSSKISYLTFLALPLMPLAYFYVIYTRQTGGLQLRANRLISAYTFTLILGTVLFLLLQPALFLQASHETIVFMLMVVALLTALSGIMIFPAFQAFVDQRLLGITLPYQNLQEAYSSRITTSTSLPHLLGLLEEEVFPSLLVRQFAFIEVLHGNLKPLLVKNVTTEKLPLEDGINRLSARSGVFIPKSSSDDEWIRLILPLKVGESFIGFWLLGRRDPDDVYLLAEIPILQAIANQTAIALSNILQAGQLRKIYQLDIERNELERKSLALDLHDSVLNELAVLRTDLDEASLTPQFNASYQEVTQRLREIVSNLRPPMLTYGLKPAIEELADNLMERSGDEIKIKVDIQSEEERLPQNIEQHLFRIVQEACENALKHAKAGSIRIQGLITPTSADLNLADNGKGFEMDSNFELGSLLSNNHFGLAGMVERAHLIDAQINIQSRINSGTSIQINWKDTPQAL